MASRWRRQQQQQHGRKAGFESASRRPTSGTRRYPDHSFLNTSSLFSSLCVDTILVQGKECVVTGEHIQHAAAVWPHIPSGALEKIRSLVMSRIGLQELDAPALHSFSRLTELDVSGNMLQSLCPFQPETLDDPSTCFEIEIKDLLPATLVKLNASNNQLWRIDGLQNCVSLRELNLSSNQYVVEWCSCVLLSLILLSTSACWSTQPEASRRAGALATIDLAERFLQLHLLQLHLADPELQREARPSGSSFKPRRVQPPSIPSDPEIDASCAPSVGWHSVATSKTLNAQCKGARRTQTLSSGAAATRSATAREMAATGVGTRKGTRRRARETEAADGRVLAKAVVT